MKVGDIVKLKNPKNGREKKRRWKVTGFQEFPVDMQLTPLPSDTVFLRRLDTATHRLERYLENVLVRVSFWERIFKRY